MMKGGKIMAGLVALAVGTGLLFSSGAALADSLLVTRSGVALGNLLCFAVGLIGIGGACDLLGPPRAPDKAKTAIAESRFASRADIEAAGLAGQRR